MSFFEFLISSRFVSFLFIFGVITYIYLRFIRKEEFKRPQISVEPKNLFDGIKVFQNEATPIEITETNPSQADSKVTVEVDNVLQQRMHQKIKKKSPIPEREYKLSSTPINRKSIAEKKALTPPTSQYQVDKSSHDKSQKAKEINICDATIQPIKYKAQVQSLNLSAAYYFPQLQINKADIIERQSLQESITEALSEDNATTLALYSHPGYGKTHIADLYARILHMESNYGVLSYAFDRHCNSLEIAAKIILKEQLGLQVDNINKPIEYLFNQISSQRVLLILDNCELLSDWEIRLLAAARLENAQLLVIINQNQQPQEFTNVLQIGNLNQSELRRHLAQCDQQYSELDEQVLSELLKFIDYKPHSLRLLAVLMKSKEGVSLEGLIDKLKQEEGPVLRRLVRMTFNQMSVVCQEILIALFVLPQKTIESDLLLRAFEDQEREHFENSLAVLHEHGLIERLYSQRQDEFFVQAYSPVNNFIKDESKVDIAFRNNVTRLYVDYISNDLLNYFAQNQAKSQKIILSHALARVEQWFNHAGVTKQYQINDLEHFCIKLIEYLVYIDQRDLIEARIVNRVQEQINQELDAQYSLSYKKIMGFALKNIAEDQSMLALALNYLNQAERNSHNQLSNLQEIQRYIASIHYSIYQHTGSEHSLEQAIQKIENAIDIYPLGPYDLIAYLFDQAVYYYAKYSLSRNSQLLTQAQNLYQQVYDLLKLHNDYPADIRARILKNSAKASVSLGIENKSPEQLGQAVQQYSQAIEIMPVQDADLHYQLGTAYWNYYKYSDAGDLQQDYLEKAIKNYLQSIALGSEQEIATEAQARAFITVQNNLGSVYRELAAVKEPIKNFMNSLQSFQKALEMAKSQHNQELIDLVRGQLVELYNLIESEYVFDPSSKRLELHDIQNEIAQDLAATL